MAIQDPHFPAAEARSFAGPFLRYGGGGEPGSCTWRGSVLCLTRAAPAGGVPLAPATAAVAGGADGSPALQGAAQGAPEPVLTLDGGAGGGSRQLSGQALDSCLGWTAWRFDLELPLVEYQRPARYSVAAGGSNTPTYAFWLPAIGQPMHWGYYSCNGISSDVPETAPERKDATYLWRDLLQMHAVFPLHCLVGGGDQVYSDGVWSCPALKTWGAWADQDKKVEAGWTAEMEGQATDFYLRNYINSFSTPDIDVAMAQIPQVCMCDDHDIWDGWGSYDNDMQNCPVFQGLWRIARRFYLLFQHHTNDAFNQTAREFLVNDGSSTHLLRWMGPQVVVLGMDMRSQRSKQQIMPPDAYEVLKRTVDALPEGPLHLVVLSGVPVIFPKIPAAESVLGCIGLVTSRLPAIKKMARNTGLLDRFDQPEILDDLVDGWVADVHTEERLKFIHMLQDWSLRKKLRVSILSGDAHVGGVGRFYSRPKIKNVGDDPLFICQIISSAIVNAPPPHPVVKMLMRTNFASNVDGRTREKLVRAFYPRHPRTDKLIAQRNWCDICLVAPPFTPPTVPQDPTFGGLLFTLRVENATQRRGYAEETYRVLVPRHPGAATSASGIAGAAAVPSGGPLPMPSDTREQRQQHDQQRLPLNAVAPEEGAAGAGQGQGAAHMAAMPASTAGAGPHAAALVAPATPSVGHVLI